MSCQQVPRLTEDPYTFTDTAPTTATLFNPQIHKLTPISNQTEITKSKFQSQKAQAIPQNQRIFSNQSLKPQTILKQQQQQQHQHQHQTTRLNGTNNSTNLLNGVHNKNAIIAANNSNTTNAVPTKVLPKTIQKPIQKIFHYNNNQSNVPTTAKLMNNSLKVAQTLSSSTVSQIISTTPMRKYVNVPFSQQQQQQQQQQIQLQQPLPQIVSLNQSQPLYSIAKQAQIITTGSLTPSPAVITATQNLINQQQATKLLPPLYQRNNNNNNNFQINNFQQQQQHSSIAPSINSFNVQQIRNHSSLINNNNNNTNNNSFSTAATSSLTYPSVVNSVGIQNQILVGPTTPTNQPLPLSNFAQPQQIKHLASSSSTSTSLLSSSANIQQTSTPLLNSSSVIVGYKNSAKKSIRPTKEAKEPKHKKQKTNNEHQNISISSNSTSISNCAVPVITTNEKCADKSKTIFATPRNAKIRDTRILSAGSVGAKLKSNNKSHLTSASRTRRAYSQTSHHETLQRISSVKSEWHAPESYSFDLLGPFTNTGETIKEETFEKTNRSINNYYYFEHLKKCDNTNLEPVTVQKHWLQVEDIRKSIQSWSQGREKRIELRKAQLRRQAMQYIQARKFLSPMSARKRLIFVSKALKKLKNHEDNGTLSKKCCTPLCENVAITLASYCNMHITRNPDQHLFLPCSAKFAENLQCRVPVFDISRELPLCSEHIWKDDNYQHIVQEQKPKKLATSTVVSAFAAKKRNTKSGNLGNSIATANRLPPKRSKKKRKPLLASDSGLGGMDILNCDDSVGSIGGGIDRFIGDGGIVGTDIIDSRSVLLPSSMELPLQSQHQLADSIGYQSGSFNINSNDYNHLESQVSQVTLASPNIMTTTTTAPNTIVRMSGNYTGGVSELTTQEMLNICENSSTYESSEDTGVGGLSETELMVGGHDAIEEIPLGDTRLLEEHDLTNVLNQLPEDAFNELFTTVEQNGPHEPTQEEQEYLERALEMVNKQVKSLEQMASDQLETNFLESFLDVDECQMLDDSDICNDDVLHSPDTSGIETSNLLIDGCSNSAGSCSNSNITNNPPTDLRNLVHIN